MTVKVLIIDDNPKLLELLSHFLENEGYECYCARDGRDGLAKHDQIKPDIVCLDLLMPPLTGFEVCRELMERNPDITVVIISSKAGVSDRKKCKEAGAADFIAKPFLLSDVRERIRLVTRTSIMKNDRKLLLESFKIGDLDVFPGYLHAERGGKVIDLNPRDLELLRFMHRHKGEVVKTAFLKPFCRLHGNLKEDTVISWAMQRLIRKIEKNPDFPTIIIPLSEGGYLLEG